MKNICFVISGISRVPIGGFKIIYEYANRFVLKGHKVTILYTGRLFFARNERFYLLKRFLKFFPVKIFRIYKTKWFPLHNVSEKFCWLPKKITLKMYDSLIATNVDSAYFLKEIISPEQDALYFIQDFENWGIPESKVFNSYNFGFKNIAIAPWLLEKIHAAGAQGTVVYNGFDFDYFSLKVPIEERFPYEVAFLWHERPTKRCEDAIAALKLVKEKIPELHVTAFGVFEKPQLPDWFTYIKNPTKEEHTAIYNTASIYVAASDFEGFGLTVGEAMICGCAVACTDNGGFSCMVKHEETGLLSPVYDVNKLAENISKFIQDNVFRISMARNGCDFIKQFTWEKSVSKFEAILN